jgi:hypothetical protein
MEYYNRHRSQLTIMEYSLSQTLRIEPQPSATEVSNIDQLLWTQ